MSTSPSAVERTCHDALNDLDVSGYAGRWARHRAREELVRRHRDEYLRLYVAELRDARREHDVMHRERERLASEDPIFDCLCGTRVYRSGELVIEVNNGPHTCPRPEVRR